MIAPVAIGGVGGSGTRLVAELVRSAGFYLGEDLNSALDDLWFNFLFFRPQWFLTGAARRDGAIDLGLDLVEKRAFGISRLTRAEVRFLSRASVDIARDNNFGSLSGVWALRRLQKFFVARGMTPAHREVGWGWKEPLTHLVVGEVLDHWQAARYVHVIRHGLDMAYSRNVNQLQRFGELYDLDALPSAKPSPTQTLRFWIRANQRAMDVMSQYPADRTLLVSFDELCRSPATETRRLMNFLQRDLPQNEFEKLAALPRVPASAARYKSRDLTIFDREDIHAVRDFGFDVSVSS